MPKPKPAAAKKPPAPPAKPAAPPPTPPSRLPAARSIFAAAKLPVVESQNATDPWRVADRFNFWPLSGRWAEDGAHPMAQLSSGRQGYGAHALVVLIRNEAMAPAAIAAVAAALDPVAEPKPLIDCQGERA